MPRTARYKFKKIQKEANVEDLAVQWGNMSIYNLQKMPTMALWVFDNSLLVNNVPIVAFDGFGAMRAEITEHLWKKLGLCNEYPSGWFKSKSRPHKSWSPAGVSIKDLGDQCILARSIHSNIIQCTIDEHGQCAKQCVFTLGGKKTPLEESTVFMSQTVIEETRKKSEEIADRLRKLCDKNGVIGMSGTRISWGITVEGEVLTPVGGIGLPDHTRYFLKVNGPEHFLDRRALKEILKSYQGAPLLRSAGNIQVRSRYEATRAMLIAQ